MRNLLLVASVLAGIAMAGATATSALAQGTDAAMAPSLADGWYIGGALGANQTRDADISGGNINTKADFDLGYGGLAAVGYDFANPFRAEAELSYRRNDVDSIGGVSGSGDVRGLGLMFNLLYDIETGSRFTPYQPVDEVGSG